MESNGRDQLLDLLKRRGRLRTRGGKEYGRSWVTAFYAKVTLLWAKKRYIKRQRNDESQENRRENHILKGSAHGTQREKV